MIGPLSALVGTAALLAVWMALGALVFGLGMMVHRILRTPDAEIDAAITCWLGVAFACTVLLAWNFVAPINGVASSTLLIAGWGWCVATRRKFASACRAGVTTLGRTGLLIAIGYGMWLANHARGPLINWDSGAYHIQAVRWAEAFPAVPGLANLDYRLGHQSASFLYYAAMDAGPLRGQAHHFANGFCLLLLGVGSLIGIFRYFRADRGSVLELTIHASALTVAVSYVAVDDGVASFVTDIPATAVGFVMSSAFASDLAGCDRGSPEIELGAGGGHRDSGEPMDGLDAASSRFSLSRPCSGRGACRAAGWIDRRSFRCNCGISPVSICRAAISC